MSNFSIDRKRKTVTIEDRTFRLRRRPPDGWDVYQGDEHIGWFAIAENAPPWPILSFEDFAPGMTTSARLVGRLWCDDHAIGESPMP